MNTELKTSKPKTNSMHRTHAVKGTFQQAFLQWVFSANLWIRWPLFFKVKSAIG
jgi:hypothetical protein